MLVDNLEVVYKFHIIVKLIYFRSRVNLYWGSIRGQIEITPKLEANLSLQANINTLMVIDSDNTTITNAKFPYCRNTF